MLVISLSSAVLAGVSYGVWDGLDALLGRTLPAQVVEPALGLALGGPRLSLDGASGSGLDELRALARCAARASESRRSALLAEVLRAAREDDLAEREAAGDLVEQQLAGVALHLPHAARGAAAIP